MRKNSFINPCTAFPPLLSSIDTLVRVGDVQKEVVLVVFLVEAAHGGGGRGDDVVHEEKLNDI